jgi:hypothetical protein
MLRIVFSICLLPAASTSAIGFRNDEIEMEILRASLEFEFSHSLGQKQKLGLMARCPLLPQ